MLRTLLISLGLWTMLLAACDQEVLIAKTVSDPGAYEIVALVAE